MLLDASMLRCLIELLSSRVDSDSETDRDEINVNKGVVNDASESTPKEGVHVPSEISHPIGGDPSTASVSINPPPTAHLKDPLHPNDTRNTSTQPSFVDIHNDHHHHHHSTSGGQSGSQDRKDLFTSPSRVSRSSASALPLPEETIFYPNSLVIVSAATLLESLVCSKKDTSSPELVNLFLDLLSEHSEVLVHMLRTNSFLIMENAAILMYILLKNRSSSGRTLKELILSECLVLKHFYYAAFSPSGENISYIIYHICLN